MKDFLNGYKQQAPFTINIEITEGCNLGCWFCGIQGVKKNGKTPWYFMTTEIAEHIASEIKRVGWKSKIIFVGHGEATLNKNFIEIIKIFRKYLPKPVFHMYSNAWGFNRAKNVDEYVNNFFEAGIDNIIIDCYNKENGDWHFVDRLSDKSVVVNYCSGVEYYESKKVRRILLLPSIETDKNTPMTRRLSNHAGCAFPLDETFNNKRCAMPFRELSFRWDGSVSVCCDDFRGMYPIANIKDMPIEELWNHPRFQAARIMLYNHSREFTPCRGCTNMSVRVGFLPDSSGQHELPPITDEVRAYVEAVTKENLPLSSVIKRKWEK